jgi:hypothetical protein
MANDEHVDLLMKDVADWNAWRNKNVYIRPDLSGADLRGADLHDADLCGARLENAILVNTKLTEADLTGCRIFGISAWRLNVKQASQQNLVITPKSEPEIRVDNIEVAQVIYLLLQNEKIRDV